jgi:hypothetical protein
MPGEISGAIFSEAEETSAGQTIGEVQEVSLDYPVCLYVY